MREALDILRWEGPSRIAAQWRSRYELALESRVQALAATDDEQTRCVLDALDMLPRERRRAFLRAPQIASRILARKEGAGLECGPIARGLLAELAAAGMVDELEESVWTALGDRLLDAHAAAAWRQPAAGVLDTHIVVDKAGPMDFTSGGQHDLASYQAAEAAGVERKVLQAAQSVAAAAPNAWRFVSDCVDVIALRKTAGPASGYSSSSFRFNARLMLIVNAHLEQIDSAYVGEHMVHEAVHSLLFMYEESERPFVTRGSEVEWTRLRSPWSGKELFLSSYVHACITWYALYWFWGAAAPAGIWPKEECDRLKERARRGFDSLPVSRGLAAVRAHLSPAACAMLDEAETQMPATGQKKA
jgi:hypothetical protein